MDITSPKRDYDIRVSFTEHEFKAIQRYANVLGYSSVSGFIRKHLSEALIDSEIKVSSLLSITGRAANGPLRAAQRG